MSKLTPKCHLNYFLVLIMYFLDFANRYESAWLLDPSLRCGGTGHPRFYIDKRLRGGMGLVKNIVEREQFNSLQSLNPRQLQDMAIRHGVIDNYTRR